MGLTKNEFELLVLFERKNGTNYTQRQIADQSKLSLGAVNKTVSRLLEKGYIRSDNKAVFLTESGLAALAPYRVKRAVILAAGFGSRMVPVTLNTPKPLVRVHGKRIIETVLDALNACGIDDIIVVRGYLSEQFDILKKKYPQITFLENPIYNESNNISSAFIVKDLLQNAYVLEADLLIQNPDIIRKYEYVTNYLGVYTDKTDDWCFDVRKGVIHNVKVGGVDCYHMYGISYWTQPDGKRLGECIDMVFQSPGGKERYWDLVGLDICKKEFSVEVRACEKEDIVEIDTFNELKQIDKVYDC